MLQSNHSETERQRSADSSTSQEEIFLIQGEFTLPNPLTHDHFFCPAQHAKKQARLLFVLGPYPALHLLLSFSTFLIILFLAV